MSIPGVTRVDAPHDVTSSAPPMIRGGGGRIVNNAPADFLDRERLAVRSRSYPNSQAEAIVVQATDEAAFDRVRPVERHLIAQSEAHIERTRATMSQGESINDRLVGLIARVRNGASTADVASEYKTVRALATQTADRLDRAAGEAEAWRGRVIDPYAHTQKIIGLLPLGSNQPLDISRYIKP